MFSLALSKLHGVELFNKQTSGVSVSAPPASIWATLEKSLAAITLLHLQGESKMLPVALALWAIQKGTYLKGLLS